MGNAIGDVLPIAIAMAVSPVPIIATLLMLFSKRPFINSTFFLAGWVFSLIVVGSIVLVIADPQESSSDGPSTAGASIRMAMGALLLLMAFIQWRSRPKEGEEPKMPNWMNSIESFTPVKSFGVAILLAGVNPLNLGLTIGAAMAVAQGHLSGVENGISMGFFILLASFTIAVPVLLNAVMPERISRPLDESRHLLIRHYSAITIVLGLLMGMVLLGQGIGALT